MSPDLTDEEIAALLAELDRIIDPITVYASHPPSPTTAQHSLPGGALLPYRGRSFTGGNASASPDAPELKFRIHSAPQRVTRELDRRLGTAAALLGGFAGVDRTADGSAQI